MEVDLLIKLGKIVRTIAQIDVVFSNSMIEALFRSLKHRWLFMIPITSFESFCRAVDEYLTDHNIRIPHNALRGAVPLEVFTGIWTAESQIVFATAGTAAKAERIQFNQSQKCGRCPA